MIDHLPILQVVVPLLGAPLCLLVRNPRAVGLFALLTSAVTFLISCLLLQQVLLQGTIAYALGGWAAPWGIEYRIDYLNSYLILLISAMGAIVLVALKVSLTKTQPPQTFIRHSTKLNIHRLALEDPTLPSKPSSTHTAVFLHSIKTPCTETRNA